MKILPFVFTGIIFFAVNLLVDRYLKKKYNIAESKGWIYRPINRIHSSLEAVLFLLFLIALFFFNAAPMVVIIYVALANALRALMEWKYDREKRRYLFSLSSVIFLTVFFGVVTALQILPN
ncbi:DUF4181 domain-containing protein [Sporolactobacillus shoreicorticis]|uniref:DUF4181 domain-containing protein n=1 Tax=Sporolactobacillus shoreicorticis TaxID=1923877 RepID=A0ABW5S5A1_9BACL|nr:DUF4181 domain-containing protein [Sporolactobacillus shoreicorticis]MCO7127156.1 DUF4181 domain-containing protein [Sporolactobacillus shoreicorticis]